MIIIILSDTDRHEMKKRAAAYAAAAWYVDMCLEEVKYLLPELS